MTSGEGENTASVPVALLEVPVEVWAMLDSEWKDRMREFALISLSEQPSSVPVRLLELVRELDSSYGTLGAQQVRELERARDAGEATVARLEYLLPRHIAPALAELASMMDETDAYCEDGEYLLSLASSPRARALREWIFEEFAVQLEGQGATPWPQSTFAQRVKEMSPE